jgi:hypothetical protein
MSYQATHRDNIERAQLKAQLANANAIPARSPTFQRGGGYGVSSPMVNHHHQQQHQSYGGGGHHMPYGYQQQQQASQRNTQQQQQYYAGSPGSSNYGSSAMSPNQYQQSPQYNNKGYGQQQQQQQQQKSADKLRDAGGKYPKVSKIRKELVLFVPVLTACRRRKWCSLFSCVAQRETLAICGKEIVTSAAVQGDKIWLYSHVCMLPFLLYIATIPLWER